MVDAGALLASVDRSVVLSERTDEIQRLRMLLQHWPERRKTEFSEAKRSFLMNFLDGRYRERPHLFRDDLAAFNNDLSWVSLHSADFSNLDLRDVSFAAADLTGSNFFGANLTGADLSLANLSECMFAEADLTGASLAFARIVGADFGKAVLRNSRAPAAIAVSTNFTDANLAGADFRWSNLANSVFAGCNIHDLHIDDAQIHGTALDVLEAPPLPERRAFKLFSWLHRPRRAAPEAEAPSPAAA